MLGLLVAGGAAIQFMFWSDSEVAVRSGDGALALVPSHAGFLRVLAQPWAHVIVDGQQVETTPFARQIPLSPGPHHVTLRHPHAPDERRTVQIETGERVVLDVTMQVRKPPKPEASVSLPALSSSTP